MDALRNLGIPVPYIHSGPFRGEYHGNIMLYPFRLRLEPIGIPVNLKKGRYVLWQENHFYVCFIDEDSWRMIDGDVIDAGPISGWRSMCRQWQPRLAWRLSHVN